MENLTYTTWYLQSKELQPWVYLDGVFSPEECNTIITLGDSIPRKPAKIFSEDSGAVNLNIRKNSVSWINSNNLDHHWIFSKCAGALHSLNQQFYKFDIDYIECLQYTIYDQLNDYYTDHIDNLVNGVHYRKLSFSIQLDDPNNYEGCDLIIKYGSDNYINNEIKRKKGTMIVFPSFMLHEVTPLLQGKRRSLVGWACGPTFK